MQEVTLLLSQGFVSFVRVTCAYPKMDQHRHQQAGADGDLGWFIQFIPRLR